MSEPKERSYSIRKTLNVIASVYETETGKTLRHPISPNSSDTTNKARNYIADHLRKALRDLGYKSDHATGSQNLMYPLSALEKALDQLASDATAQKNKLERIGFSAELVSKITERLRVD